MNKRKLPDRKTLAGAFGTTLRHFRKHAKMSQDALSLESEVDRRHIGDLDRGQGNPTLEMIAHVVLPLTTLAQFFEQFEAQLRRDLRNGGKTH